ncbi:YaaC family protein [Bosea sp. BIWAKO-01]|uniref:YaaC family protein n=1 Tax=Bosea sp. BIWAKO-01 TaxID=506668 RepID=UPI000853279A|nr:YaaC family protein [Bosea sp. BIWAKO-01]GAU80335.1 hypothetical protein BIWAKO_00221 [Bosea sp. BIWAKO-01]
MTDWYNLKFLESATNLSNVLKRSFDHELSVIVARDVTVALQQGRLFFEQAQESPIQIRPLLVYYGVLSFARAVTMAVKNIPLAEIVPSHGISDAGAPTSVEGLSLTVKKNGTFQQFNDVIAPLSRFYYSEHSMPQSVVRPFDLAAPLEKKTITILDILSRLSEPHGAIDESRIAEPNYLHVDVRPYQLNSWHLRLDERPLIENRENLVALVSSLRDRYPFLKHWRLQSAQLAYNRTLLMFDNRSENMGDDLSEMELIRLDETTYKSAVDRTGGGENYVRPEDILPPLTGGYGQYTLRTAVRPLHGVALNEYPLLFLGSFLLSSLVRYRPELWQHALSRSNTTDFPADDRSLSAIERFVGTVLASFPPFVVSILDYRGNH